MKKHDVFVKILMIGLVLMLVVAACAPAPAEEAPADGGEAAEEAAAPPEPPAEGEKVMVALLLPGPITDGGWGQLAYEGLEALGEDDNFEVSYSENIGQAQIPEITRGYADDGYHLIIGHGFEFGSAFLEIAPEYPDQWFFATTFQPQPDIAPNIRYVDAAYYEAAYTAGALAALMSESGAVGFVGGGDNPTQQNMLRSFVFGAEGTVDGTNALGVVTGDYNDATKGREAATTMIGNGADVIWHAADVTGLGAIEGAIANDALVLGCYSDQTSVAPDHMGSSIVMNLKDMVVIIGNEVKDGTFEGGVEWRPSVDVMWYWSAGDAEYNADLIDDATWAEFQKVWDEVASGAIDVKAMVAGEPEAAPAEESSGEPTMVALLLPGPITDGGWGQLAYEGLEALGEDANFEVSYSENIGQAQIPEITRGYADDGYHLIIGHGFEFGSAFLEIAPEYPDQWFFATTFQPQPEIADNIRYVDAAYYEAAYTAGALAALMSESGTVGFVGGGDNPTQQNMLRSFVFGAEGTVDGANALGVVTGDYNDATKGREAATTMIGNGADVIWHAADVTGLGAIEGAIANDALVLGCYSDQTGVAPDHMGSSIVMNLKDMVVIIGNEVRDGTFEGGVEWRPSVDVMWYWAAGDADHNPDLIDDATWAEFQKVWDEVASGAIDVKAMVAE